MLIGALRSLLRPGWLNQQIHVYHWNVMDPSSLQVGFMSFIVGGSALWYRLDELL